MYRKHRIAQIPSGRLQTSENHRVLQMTPIEQSSATSIVESTASRASTGVQAGVRAGAQAPVSYTGDRNADAGVEEVDMVVKEEATSMLKWLLIGGVGVGVLYMLSARRA